MKIFILRHGNAEQMQSGHTDKHRCLSEKGFKQIRQVATWMNEHHHSPQLILSSPYKRCRQTAETLQHNLSTSASTGDPSEIPLKFEECLIYGSDPNLTLDLITPLTVDSVLLCSHMPLVSELANLFAAGAMMNSFNTAELVKIRYDRESQHGVVTANVVPNEF